MYSFFDFINRSYSNVRGAVNIYNLNQINSTASNAYLLSKNVCQSADTLDLSDVMLQKYIALWGWGFVETWTDMRRYDYYQPSDPSFARFQAIYKGFLPPNFVDSRNEGKFAQRVRPHYTSEYTYNIDEVKRVGIDRNNWHVGKMWFSQPQ